MKLKLHSNPIFLKAILLAVFVCAILVVRTGSFKVQKTAHKERTLKLQPVEIKPAEVAVVPPIAVPAPIVAPVTVVEAPIEILAPQKRFSVQKRVKKVRPINLKEIALKKLLEDELVAFDVTTDALEINAPIDQLISQGFAENNISSESFFYSNRKQRSENILVKAEEVMPEVEPTIYLTEGKYQKNKFEEIRSALESIKEQEKEIQKTPLKKLAEKAEEKNILVSGKAPAKPLVVMDNGHLSETESTQAPQVNTENEGNNPIEKEDSEEEEDPTLATPTRMKMNLSPVQAATGNEIMSSQLIEAAIAASKASPVTSTQKAVSTQNVELPLAKIPDPEAQVPPAPPAASKLNGILNVDNELNKWLEVNRGHIELSLHKEGSRNSEDTLKLDDYRYPSREFEYDTSKLEGKFQFVANIYSYKAKAPYLQIVYPKALSPENFGERVSFNLKNEGFSPPRGKPVLNVTIFEAAGGNYRQAKAVSDASAYFVGLESLGKFKTDSEGNIRVENIPLNSELIINVEASGYYPTRKIIPITSISAYATVNLIEKQKVDAVTGFFTKKPQDDKKTVLFGRVYDTDTRKPLAEDEVSLSNRKGHALYFGALPDTSLRSTTPTGLFAFMNVEPAFRAIFRSKSDHAMPLHLLPGYGYYMDLGRGGKKSIKAIVTDPVQNQVVQGSASTIGNNKNTVETNEVGKFEIKNVDLPTGNVTVEFRAKDYPVTWYTMPWDTRETPKIQKLFILEKELIYESAMSFARLRPEKHKGIMVGGANPALFKGKNSCVRVELLDNNGKAIQEDKGPYLLYERSHPSEKPCLTAAKPGFAFYNLDAGEYILHWKNQSGKVLSSQVVRVGTDRLSVVVR